VATVCRLCRLTQPKYREHDRATDHVASLQAGFFVACVATLCLVLLGMSLETSASLDRVTMLEAVVFYSELPA
jgi:hypothetical protein